MYGHLLQTSSYTNEWKIGSGVIFRSGVDETSLWWKPQPAKGTCSFRSWSPLSLFYCISPNSHTLVILLQVNPAFDDEPEIVYEGCYKTKDTSIFAWSSIPSVGHYHWLCSPICQLLFNSKADYLVRTIWRILNFMQLWTIIVA